MIFALGFLVAGLAALAFAPAFWRRADRLTRRRLEMQIPLSVQEILAERDQLRAEFAVERCRLDQRAEQLRLRHAADLARLGRQASEITSLNAELAESASAKRAADHAQAETDRRFRAAQAELGALHKALYDVEGLLERKQDEWHEYVRAQESVKQQADTRFTELATANVRVASLELRLGDVSRNVLEAERKLAEKDRHARSLSDVLAATRYDLDVAEGKLARLQEKADAEARRAAQLNEEFAALRQKHDADLGQLRTLMVKMNVNEAMLQDAQRRGKDMLAQRDQLAERAREAERGLLEQNIHLRSEHAAMQGALDVARQRCEELESALAKWHSAATDPEKGAVSAAGDDDLRLRQSISEIGAAIVRMTRPNGEGATARLPAAAAPAALAKTDAPTETREADHETLTS